MLAGRLDIRVLKKDSALLSWTLVRNQTALFTF
jgi:hypothetical protein